MAGKGSAPRAKRDDAAYASNWDKIFGKKQDEPKFLSNYKEDENGCFIYLGAIKKIGLGYGWVGYKGTQMAAHRAAWIHKYGEIPDGLFVCHKCDVPACMNTDHLFLGTQSDNMKDMWMKNRHKKQDVKGDKHPRSKLDIEQVREIRKMLSDGEKQKVIAEKFSISQTAVSEIKTNRKWVDCE